MRFLLCFVLAMLLCPAAAAAQGAPAANEPRIAPAGDWVEQLAIPVPDPALRDRPFQMLLSTSQSRYGAEHHDHYLELAFHIQNGQGLQGLGNVVLPWRPDQTELIIHRVRIVRGATVIDLLANGQRFTVLRRESNLESAVLDGMLSAVMQPEGLAVGDTLNIAWTVRRRPGMLPLRGENFFFLMPGMALRRYFVRQIWPSGSAMRWRGTGALERPRTRTTRFGTELTADLADVETPQPPAQAPARFNFPTTLQLSEFRDWAELGTMIAPHYERAWQLGPDSPLHARISQIAAASQDPRTRTMAALRLVQDEIRYFALVMGDGNYLPATAEQTWSRRFADCKGKVVLLIALLRGLGIDAEPVLVNTGMGDGMDERLPQLSLFDHMIVRVRIEGRSYWLDGTRTGDRVLEDLASSTFGWGLPVRASGSSLEQLPFAPPSLPLAEHNVTYDGSGGFGETVPVRVEWLYRGDIAEQMRANFSQVGRDAFLRGMRESRPDLPGTNDEVTTFDVRDEPAAGAFTVIVAGRARMDWRPAPGAASQRFRFDNEMIRWPIDLERPAGPFRDAPYAFPVPAFIARTDTVILPNGGEGFSIDGQSFDHLVAGTQISRRLGIANGRATARSEFRRIEREVSAASARQAEARIDAIGDDEAWLRAPMGTAIAPRGASTPIRAPGAPAPESAQALVRAGFAKMDEGRHRAALEDFDRAIALSPQWALAHADRGIALVHLGRLDEAEPSLATAIRLDDTDFAAHQGMGLLRLRQGRPEDAVPALTRSLELRPANVFTLRQRAAAYEGLYRLDEAIADLDAIVAAEPRHAGAHRGRARILAHRGREAEAVAAIDRALEADPTNSMIAIARGDLLARFGRIEQAAAAYRAALAMVDALGARLADNYAELEVRDQRIVLLARSGQTAEAMAIVEAQLRRFADNPQMLAARCRVRAEANSDLAEALRDCNEALRVDPGQPLATAARALVFLRQQRWADAERDFTRLIADEPRTPHLLYGRGLARLGRGDRAGADADMQAARRFDFDVAHEYARLNLTPPAPATPN